MIRAAGALVLACVGAAGAATWTCPRRTPASPVNPNVVVVHCIASGTYTAGGDFIGGGGVNTELCNSENRIPIDAVPSTAASATTGQGYVVAYKKGGAIVLLTASAAPGTGQALVELDPGVSIEGATFEALVVCK